MYTLKQMTKQELKKAVENLKNYLNMSFVDVCKVLKTEAAHFGKEERIPLLEELIKEHLGINL